MRVKRLELWPGPLFESADPLDGILGPLVADECHVAAAGGTQPASTHAQLAAAQQILGPDKGEAAIAKLVAIDVRVDGDDLDTLLLQLAKLFHDGHVVRVDGRDAEPDDVGLGAELLQLLHLSGRAGIVDFQHGSQPRLPQLQIVLGILQSGPRGIPEGRVFILQDDDPLEVFLGVGGALRRGTWFPGSRTYQCRASHSPIRRGGRCRFGCVLTTGQTQRRPSNRESKWRKRATHRPAHDRVSLPQDVRQQRRSARQTATSHCQIGEPVQNTAPKKPSQRAGFAAWRYPAVAARPHSARSGFKHAGVGLDRAGRMEHCRRIRCRRVGRVASSISNGRICTWSAIRSRWTSG